MIITPYQTINRQKKFWKKIIESCPFGILHIISPETGNKTTALVEVTMDGNTNLSCMVEHTIEENLTVSGNEISLKLCNRDKNLYAVADVTVYADNVTTSTPQRKLRFEIQKLVCFRKNQSQQLVSWNAA